MPYIVVIASLVGLLLALFWVGHCKDKIKKAEYLSRHYQLQADELARHFKEYGSVSMVWQRPKAHNKADDFYYRVRINKKDFLFTEEQMTVGEKRAEKASDRGWL